MVEKIEQYKASDGTIFDDENEAELYEAEQVITDLIQRFPHSSDLIKYLSSNSGVKEAAVVRDWIQLRLLMTYRKKQKIPATILPEDSEYFQAKEEFMQSVSGVLVNKEPATIEITPTWKTQQEANGLWSAYYGGGFRRGNFRTREGAEDWIIQQIADEERSK